MSVSLSSLTSVISPSRYSIRKLVEAAVAQGALAYLVKPLDVDQLLDALELCFVP